MSIAFCTAQNLGSTCSAPIKYETRLNLKTARRSVFHRHHRCSCGLTPTQIIPLADELDRLLRRQRLRAEVIEHEQPNGGRKVALLAIPVDLGYHVRQCRVLALRNLLQASPECIFEAYAGLVSANDYGALDDL